MHKKLNKIQVFDDKELIQDYAQDTINSSIFLIFIELSYWVAVYVFVTPSVV